MAFAVYSGEPGEAELSVKCAARNHTTPSRTIDSGVLVAIPRESKLGDEEDLRSVVAFLEHGTCAVGYKLRGPSVVVRPSAHQSRPRSCHVRTSPLAGFMVIRHYHSKDQTVLLVPVFQNVHPCRGSSQRRERKMDEFRFHSRFRSPF